MTHITFFQRIKALATRLRMWFLFHFRLKPRIKKMGYYVARFANVRRDSLPMGKSVLTFRGDKDIVYFILLKDDDAVNVVEIYDDLFHQMPENYRLLEHIEASELAAD